MKGPRQWVTAVGGEARKESGITQKGLDTQLQAGGSISVLPTDAPCLPLPTLGLGRPPHLLSFPDQPRLLLFYKAR